MAALENMNLFEQLDKNDAFFGEAPGYRLFRLEVLNWGTFDKEVWSFNPQGETTLLTGDVGSGKSTLVDALTTLLVSPRKVAYNKAADSSAKERTLATYIKGNYGQKRSAESGVERPESLRDVSHYSVLLAVFRDRGADRFVTLAQFFWFLDAQAHPARFYVVADRDMGVAQDFANFNHDVRVLKKRLKQDGSVQVFEDYTRYAGVFRRKFGIVQEQALDLFQQTISMKKVEALTDFVRANMLEPPTTEEDIVKLIEHFSDLNKAHEAVLKARDQVEMLNPLVEKGGQCERLNAERERLERTRGALPSWFAEKTLKLLAAEIASAKQTLELASAELARAESELIKIDDGIITISGEIRASGGGALELLKQELSGAKKDLERIQKNRLEYENNANLLKLPVPDAIDAFIASLRSLPELKSAEDIKQGRFNDEYASAVVEKKKREQELEQITGELESLRSRKSSIPKENVDKRKELCRALKIAEDDLPFVGELIEVREDEARWEGAIERLLRNFGLSLLVPDSLYHDVANWVEKTSLGIRLVYYRVKKDASPAHIQLQRPSGESVFNKINIKPATDFGIWLSRELAQRFPHVCCSDMEKFRQEPQAVSTAGQIKTRGERHEKDDRHNINDRRRFILGFSNQKKIAALEESERKLEKIVDDFSFMAKTAQNKLKTAQLRINAISGLERIDEFADIDTKSKESEIVETERRIAKLERGNDVLQGLRRQLAGLEEKKTRQHELIKKKQERKNYLEKDIKDYEKRESRNISIAGEVAPAEREFCYPILEGRKAEALGGTKLTLENDDKLRTVFGNWLATQTGRIFAESQRLGNAVVHLMTQYRNKFPEHTMEIDSSLESLPEYKAMLEQLEKDGLPKFENHFRKLLHENTINQIALFQAKLKHEQDSIKARIEQINGSLSAIDYNEGRYIRLEYDETYDSEIKDFRVQLKACTEGALTGPGDDQYAETKFLQVKAVIERFAGRPGDTEWDARWTKKVVDVRNWFLFAASERWRETDEEYEHYKDSSGKSGGQKEKLAYTILAASLVYHFGLEGQGGRLQSFRFVVIDEAFLKSSDDSARFGLELFKRLDLQLLIVTPLLKIPTIEPYISHVGFVYQNDVIHRSMLRNITIEEYRSERRARAMIELARKAEAAPESTAEAEPESTAELESTAESELEPTMEPAYVTRSITGEPADAREI